MPLYDSVMSVFCGNAGPPVLLVIGHPNLGQTGALAPYVGSKHQVRLLSVGQQGKSHQAQALDQLEVHHIGNHFAFGFDFE